MSRIQERWWWLRLSSDVATATSRPTPKVVRSLIMATLGCDTEAKIRRSPLRSCLPHQSGAWTSVRAPFGATVRPGAAYVYKGVTWRVAEARALTTLADACMANRQTALWS